MRGVYNSGSTTTRGSLLGDGMVAAQQPAANAGTAIVWQSLHGTSIKSKIPADGTAMFASGNLFLNFVADGANVVARNDSTNNPVYEVYKGGLTANDRTARINSDGSAEFGSNIKSDGQIRSDRFKCGNNADQDKILLNNDGSASFTETVSIGSGSAAPDDYGLIAYANANTLSNKSAVYARNLADGRNFTGDNSSGATTFEVYANGSATFAGTVDVGSNVNLNDSTVDLYSQTTNASSKTFQLFSDIGGTKVEKLSIQANGNVVIGNDIDSSLNGIKMYVSGSDPSIIAAKADNNPDNCYSTQTCWILTVRIRLP